MTLIQAKAYPNLQVVCLSPGFIDTPMTAGFGARLTPEQGCVAPIKCLFEPVTTGYYYERQRDSNPRPFGLARAWCAVKGSRC